jgi:hypothetical protein
MIAAHRHAATDGTEVVFNTEASPNEVRNYRFENKCTEPLASKRCDAIAARPPRLIHPWSSIAAWQSYATTPGKRDAVGKGIVFIEITEAVPLFVHDRE